MARKHGTGADARRGRTVGGAERTPGQRAGLSRDEIVACARRLAEQRGVERVTMRGLAAELGVAPNALYTYFPEKTAILDALFDDLLGEIEPPDPLGGRWQDALAELMRASRRLMLAHPDLVTLFLSRPGGPNALRLGEVTLQILARGGIRGRSAVEALRALLAYTMGSAALEVARLTEPERGRRVHRAAAAIERLPAAAFPRTLEVADDLSAHPMETDFEAGLDWLIRGIGSAATG